MDCVVLMYRDEPNRTDWVIGLIETRKRITVSEFMRIKNLTPESIAEKIGIPSCDVTKLFLSML